MQEVLDLLHQADVILCNRMNALTGQGETRVTSPILRHLGTVRQDIWNARKALIFLEEPTCEKS